MISIVIPSLPGYEELNGDCIASYKDTKNDQTELDIQLVVQDKPFAQNVNEGLKLSKGEIILISNNDVTALPEWDKWLVKASHTPGIISLTPRFDCGWGFGITRELLEQVGLLDERLINSYEDYDYFIRAAIYGYNRILAPKNYAIHQGGVTLNKLWGINEEQSRARISQSLANREYMVQKWNGFNVDSIPYPNFGINGSKIMKEFMSGSSCGK